MSDASAEGSPPVKTDYAFTARVHVGEPLTVDRTPGGVRRYIPIIGGEFEGPLAKGTVIAVGGDSQIIRSDGVLVLEAKYMLRTDDGVLISVVNRGLRRGSATVMARLMKGEYVRRENYYFRTVAQFDAPLDSPYAELNNYIFVGTAEREPATAIVHFYRLL